MKKINIKELQIKNNQENKGIESHKSKELSKEKRINIKNNKEIEKNKLEENKAIEENKILKEKKEIEDYKAKEIIKLNLRNKQINKINSKHLQKIFKKYFEKKTDLKKLKQILDPLRSGFKTNLKEIYQYEGRNKQVIFIKKSTANIISFGNSFQLISDDNFYKDHKRIISVYPNIEKEANILVIEKKERKDNLIEKLENNERKIRFIVNDNDALLRVIKSKSLNPSKSQSSFHRIKKFN